MKEFDSLGKFAMHLLELEVGTAVALQAATEAIGAHVEKVARAEFGSYQDATGAFPAWEELADSTKEDRLYQGFTENEPLLRSGDLQGSISHAASQLEAIIGSDDPVMVFHEFGTSKMPMRPVLGPAAHNSKDKIEEIVGVAVVNGFIGEEAIHPALGYDFETENP